MFADDEPNNVVLHVSSDHERQTRRGEPGITRHFLIVIAEIILCAHKANIRFHFSIVS
jgi:hypothetical protein